MTMPIQFDTLEYARKLAEGGIPQPQAEVHAQALSDVMATAVVAPSELVLLKTDVLARIDVVKRELTASIERANDAIALLRRDVEARIDLSTNILDAKIDGVKQELSAKIDGVKQEFDAKIDNVKHELSAKIDSVKYELNTSIDGVKHELNAKIDDTKHELCDKIQALDVKIDRTAGQCNGLRWLLYVNLAANAIILIKLFA